MIIVTNDIWNILLLMMTRYFGIIHILPINAIWGRIIQLLVSWLIEFSEALDSIFKHAKIEHVQW